MKNTIQKIKNLALATILVASSLVGANASAWGPDRDHFTMENPASYPVFNSIENNPTIGDEFDFVRVGQINADVTELGNEVEVVPGKQYLVYIYFHNDASSTYNDAAHDNVGVAVRTRVSTSFNNVLTPDKKAEIKATITADNSRPTSVWDEAYMTTTYGKVVLHYVAGSAKIYNDYKANGSVMPSSIFSEEGALIGLNELNGIIPGCEQYHGSIAYVLQAEELAGIIEKSVSKDGTNYADSIEALPGDELTFRLDVKNSGDMALNNAVVADAMPAGLELVPGSVQFSANNSGVWEPLSDNLVKEGYNFGTIGAGNVIHITYRAKVSSEIDCNGLNFSNTATLTYDSEVASGDKDESSVAINVKRDDCTPPTPPETPPDTPTEIVKTGPLEITMAVIVILGIGAGGFYLYRTRRTLKTVEGAVTGPEGGATPTTPTTPATPTTSTTTTEPTTPGEPVAPASFSEPAEPAAPAEPTTPAEPSAPESTESPENPEKPEEQA